MRTRSPAPECQPGGSQVYLTFSVSNQLPDGFLLTQAPEERGLHRGAGIWQVLELCTSVG